MAAFAVRQIGITRELHMTLQLTVGRDISVAEDLAQRSNPVIFKHIHIHAAADGILDSAVFDIKVIIGDTAVFHSLFMIADVPFFSDPVGIRQGADGSLQHRKSLYR